MSDTEKRIFELADILGFDIVTEEKTKAFFKALSSGIDLIISDLDFLQKQIYPLTSQGCALSMNCNMFSINGNITENEKIALISEAFKRRYGDYKKSEVFEELERLDFTHRTTVDNTIYIQSKLGSVSESENLSKMSVLLKNYIVPGCVVDFHGNGIDFDSWDNMPYVFNELDAWGFTFNMMETF